MRFARRALSVLGGAGIAGIVMWLSTASPAAAAAAPTFSKDIAPIIFNKCAECHRPTGMAPMSLLTYDEARPWARAVKQKTRSRDMPPWGADPTVGRFQNDPSLSAKELETVAAWVDGGAPEGNKADLPKPPQFAEGWTIGKPDLIFKMVQPVQVPADGVVPYSYVTIPTNLKEDIWIRGVELRPTDRRVVHHIISDLVEGNGKPVDPEPKLVRDRTRKDIEGDSALVWYPAGSTKRSKTAS